MEIGILGTGGVAQTLARRWAAAVTRSCSGRENTHQRTVLNFLSRPAGPSSRPITSWSTPPQDPSRWHSSKGSEPPHSPERFSSTSRTPPRRPSISSIPDASLAEKLQAALPDTHVVKTMNTAAMSVMTEPGTLPASSVFVSGDDAGAKATAAGLLADLGWPDGSIVDLGGIRSARGPEHYFVMFAALMQSLHTPQFNIRLVV
jgi:8-hydroxy-5-deazaflavin:NADPH oxidoreductase